ncbi:carbon monoxide dehydrogenase subunit G [Constrictibacter sp. MBR-5]|uniref:CoxG family protein n=1 Tax=Constrictibacter sp. MBR-5 TaxID=3156467 RepID=UPI00339910DA
MEMKGESRIEAPRDRVWAALNDPEVLKASIPGCEELERTEDGGFAAKVRAKVGPVSARFGGKVVLSDIDAPNGYRISGEGTGGAAGFAKGGADVKLEADGDQATILRYDVQATVGGKLAQIGSRLIDGTARKMADEFFASFKAQVEGAGGAAAEAPAVAEAPPQMSQGAAPTPPGQQPPPPPQPTPRERPAESMPSEGPAHTGPTDMPSTTGAMADPIAAASQPAAVDRAAETIRTGGHREHMVEDPDEASEDAPGRRTAGEATAGPGGYRAEVARRSSTSPWVWAVGAAVVVVILIVAFT